MNIELISQEEFDIISDIQKKYEVLTFQNDGYQYIRKPFSDDEKQAVKKVEEILRKHIKGFSSFTNFRHSVRTGGLQIRLQYNYNYDNEGLPFIGVGYILLEELLTGFTVESNGN